MRRLLAGPLAAIALLLSPAIASAFDCGGVVDDFQRSSLGSGWTQRGTGTPLVVGARGAYSNINNSALATRNNAPTSTDLCADVDVGIRSSWVGLIAAYNTLEESYLVRIGDPDQDGRFDKVFFNRGGEGPILATSTIAAPFASARLHVRVTGTVMTLDVDTNFDNTPETTYSHDFLTPTGGTGYGISSFDSGSVATLYSREPPLVAPTAEPLQLTEISPQDTPVDPGLSATSPLQVTGARVAITAGAAPGDELRFTGPGAITSTYDASTRTLTLTGRASPAVYQTALRSVQLRSVHDTSTTKTVSFVVVNEIGESAVATRGIVVNAEDAAPVAGDDAATVTEDAAATTIDVLANDANDSGPMRIEAVTQPAGGDVVVAADGLSLTYEPDADFCTRSGTDRFEYTLTRGDTATVDMGVTCVDDAPVAVDDVLELPASAPGTAQSVPVLTNDTDVDGVSIQQVIAVTQPVRGTVAVAGRGLSYTAAVCPAAADPVVFTYTLRGGSKATVTLTTPCSELPQTPGPAPTPPPVVVPAPGPAASVPLVLQLKAPARAGRTLARKGRFGLVVRCGAAPCRLMLTGRLTAGGRTLGTIRRRTIAVAAGKTAVVPVTITAKTRRLAARARKAPVLTLRAAAAASAGQTAAKRLRVGLPRPKRPAAARR